MKKRRRGYIAVDRELTEHPAFGRRDHWIVAFIKMLGYAAFQPCAQRGDWGVVHVERTEFATTIRTLAEEWDWPKSNVDCFLKRLVRFGIVELNTTRTATRTTTGTSLPHPVTVVRICNYDKYHQLSPKPSAEPDRHPGQDPKRSAQQPLPLTDEFAAQPANHSNQIQKQEEGIEFGVKGSGDRLRGRTKPNHRARSRNGGVYIWLDHGTTDWRNYADDYQAVTGAQIFPERRIGGDGNWFVYDGEIKRPQRRRRVA